MNRQAAASREQREQVFVNANRKEGEERQLKTGPPTIMEGDQFG
ncbi:hypothetical protein [Pseudarthrobacter sp. H2]